MKLSIIIPAYNAEDTIEKSVMSIVNQNIDTLQVIIVDDRSTDRTFSVCKKLQNAFSCIEIYQTSGKGVSNARNTGLMHAQGEIIGFCDADDYFEDCVFQDVINEFQKDPYLDLLCYGFNCIDMDGCLICQRNIKTRYITSEKMLDRVLNDQRIMGSVWNKFYRKRTVANMYFEESLSYCEDTAFNAKLLIKNRNLKCMIKDMRIYNYVSNMSSTTHNFNCLFNDSGVLKYNESMYYIRNICINKKQTNYVNRAIFCLSVGEYCNNVADKKQKDILRSEVCKYFFTYCTSIFKFEPMKNLKIILKGLIIVLSGSSGNLYNFLYKTLKTKRKLYNDNK